MNQTLKNMARKTRQKELTSLQRDFDAFRFAFKISDNLPGPFHMGVQETKDTPD